MFNNKAAGLPFFRTNCFKEFLMDTCLRCRNDVRYQGAEVCLFKRLANKTRPAHRYTIFPPHLTWF